MSLTEVAELVRRETGITPAVAQENALRAALRRAAPELDPGAVTRAVSDPVRGRDLVERLIAEATAQETSVARDRGERHSIPRPRPRLSARATRSSVIRMAGPRCTTG